MILNFIDTSNYYARDGVAANELIREALHPYPDDVVIVTKVGALVEGSDLALPAAEKTGLTPTTCAAASRRTCARSAWTAWMS